jgi:hypothetical protein
MDSFARDTFSGDMRVQAATHEPPKLPQDEFSKNLMSVYFSEFLFEDKEVDERFLHRFEILSVLRVLKHV